MDVFTYLYIFRTSATCLDIHVIRVIRATRKYKKKRLYYLKTADNSYK